MSKFEHKKNTNIKIVFVSTLNWWLKYVYLKAFYFILLLFTWIFFRFDENIKRKWFRAYGFFFLFFMWWKQNARRQNENWHNAAFGTETEYEKQICSLVRCSVRAISNLYVFGNRPIWCVSVYLYLYCSRQCMNA